MKFGTFGGPLEVTHYWGEEEVGDKHTYHSQCVHCSVFVCSDYM